MKQGRFILGKCLIASVTLFLAGCATSVPMAACTKNQNETQKVFDKVLFNGTGRLRWSFPFGYETKGKLLLFKDSMEFRKSNGTGFEMRDIRNVSLLYLHMTPLDLTKWVAVEYGLPPNSRTVYFADGSALGWGSVFGGTPSIYNAVKSQYMEPSVK